MAFRSWGMHRGSARSSLGRVARVAGAVVLGLLALAAAAVSAAFIYARTEVGREQVRQLVLGQARAHVPGLRIGHVGGDYVHDLILDDVSVVDDSGRTAVAVARLSARYDLLALLRHTVAVRELRVEGARLVVRPEADGTLNVQHLVAPSAAPASPKSAHPPGGASGRWRVRLDRLAVVDLAADARLADGSRAIVSALDLSARLALDADRLNARLDELEIRSGPAGRITAQGSASVDHLGGAQPRLGDYELAVQAENLDPAALLSRAPAARLGFSLSLDGHGLPLAEDAAAQLALTVAPSDAAGVHLESARVVARADGPRWTLSSASARGAGVSVLASGEGEGARLAADLRATLEGRPPHPPGGGAGRLPDIRGGGALAVHVEGTWPDVEVTAHGQVAQLRAGAARVGRATLEAHVRDPVRLPAGHLTVRARGVRLGGEAPALDSVVLSATGDRRRLRVDGAVAGPRVRGNLRARGTLSPSEIDVALQALALDFTTARYRQTLDLKQQARVRFRPGDSVRWEGLAVHGAGFRFTGDLRSDGVYRFAPAGRRPVAALTLALRQAAIDGFNPVDADLDASLSRQRAAVKLQAALPAARAQVRLDADLPLVVPRAGPPRLAEHGDVHVDLRTNEVHLETLPVVEKALRRQGVSGGVAALSATINGDIAHPDARLAFDLRDVMYRNIRGHGRDSRLKTIPGLGGSLTVETPPGAVRATAVLRIRNAGVLTADARLAAELRRLLDGADVRRVPVTATIGIPGFALASLADFTDELKGLSGQLSGQLHLTGTLARPSGTADLQIDGAKVDDLAFRDVRLQGQAGGGRVSATLNIVEATGGTLTGSLALDRAAGDRLQATARGQNLDLRFLRPFVATAREIAGQAQLSATVGGTLAAPQIDASLTVDKGRLGLIGQPTFSDVRVAATLKPGRADLTTLEMRSGSGSLSASGWVGLDGFQPRRAVLRGHAHRFLVAAAGSTGALVDGDFAADAVLRRDLVSGAAQIPRAQVWLPKGPGGGGGRDLQKIGAHDDVRFVDEAARAAEERQLADAAAASPRRIDLGVRTGTVYVRGKDLDIELDSTLKLGSVPSGPRTGAPTLSGGIHIRRGRINIQGQRFDFDRGDVNFDGSPDFNPRLDIVLQRQYSDARVVVQLTGTPRKPELKLTSDPPIYDQAQIVSLILTGQPGGQPSTGKSFDPTAAVATAVLSRLADQIAPEIGLDVLRVESVDVRNQEGESTGATDMRVELGKYISDRIYVSYAHVFGAPDTANQNEAHVEYRVTRRWMVETIFGDAGVGGVDALWTLRY